MAKKKPEPNGQKLPSKLKFDYIKSNVFRVIHADGVIGGPTPRLSIHMDFWSERFPIPQQTVHEVNPDGGLGEELKEERQSRKAIVREVEIGVVMDLDTAKSFREWLNDKITEIERVLAERGQKA